MSKDRSDLCDRREQTTTGFAKTERLVRVVQQGLTLEFENGKRWILGTESIRLGRSERCELPIFDPSVSQLHAKIVCSDEGWEIIDQESTNGTFLNGVRTQRAQLQPGSVLSIGRTVIRCVPSEGVATKVLSNDHEALSGDSEVMRQLRRQVAQAASTPYPVLIRGESGTGKELVAQAVHRLSRRSGSWVSLNAAAIPEMLFESELFGHERGAFTGANTRRKGAFEQADKGTLFLDEVGDLPLTQQAKLLRVLELGEYRRVGGEQTQTAQCKFVCATHRDVDRMVREERFRADLLFRVRGHELVVPSLRERLEDLPALAKKLCERVGRELERPLILEDKTVFLLLSYSWPGNVRELLAVLRRAASKAPAARIGPEHIGSLGVVDSAEINTVSTPSTIPPPPLETAVAVEVEVAEETPSLVSLEQLVAEAVQYETFRRAQKKAIPNGKALLVMYNSVGRSISALARATSLSRAALRERVKKAQIEYE